MVGFQRRADGLVERDAGVAIGCQRGYFGGLGSHQVPLLLNHVVGGRGAQGVFLLLGVAQLLTQNPVPDGGFVTDPGLPQGYYSIGRVNGNLVETALQSELGLAQLKLIDSVVGLRLVVAERRLKESANALGRKIAPEDLA
jgi:hypothetical protein